MLKFQSQVYTLLVVLLVAITIGMAEDAAKCQGINMEMTEETAMSVMECLQEVQAASFKEVPADKKPCFGKCILMKKNLVDDQGMVHKENIMQIVQETIPKPVADDLTKKLEQCFTDNGSNLEMSGEKCDSFSPLMECMHMSFMDTCRAES